MAERLTSIDTTRNFLVKLGIEKPEENLVLQIDTASEIIRQRGGVVTDLDSTYFLSEEIAITDFNRDHGTNYQVSDLTDRYLMVEWAKALGVESPLEYAIKYWNNPERLAHLARTPGTAEVFEYLHDISMPTGRTTARPSRTAEATFLYFALYEPHVDTRSIYVQDQDLIDPKFKKKIITEIFRAAVALEDAPEEAEDIGKEGVVVGLYPTPWNSGYEPVSENIITLDQVFSGGFQRLALDIKRFRLIPKMGQVYLAVNDKVLQIHT